MNKGNELFHAALSAMREQQMLCDIVIKIDGRQFSAHKVILAASIPYFHAMFSSGMKESNNKEIEMQGIDAIALETLINFAYSSQIDLNENNVKNILITASFLQFSKATDACADYLLERLNPKNAIGIRNLVQSVGSMHLADKVFQYIANNFYEVTQHEEFSHLTIDAVKELLSKNDINVESEEQVFEACMRWIKHNTEERRDKLPELLTHVRLTLLKPSYIIDHVASDDLIRNSIQCRDLLDEARNYHLLPPKRRASMQLSFPTKLRCYELNYEVSGLTYIVGGYNEHCQTSNSIEYFDPRTNNWHPAPAMTTSRKNLGVAVINKQIYAIGGRRGHLASVEVYDAMTKEWKMVSPMQNKRNCFGTAVLNDTIYVCGGRCDDSNLLNSVESYCPSRNTWHNLAPMNKSRNTPAATAFQGYIYVLGGRGVGGSVLDSVERYDPSTNTWTEVAPMLTKRCDFGVAMLYGKLYACGGRNGCTTLNTVEMFDSHTNKWTNVASMNECREEFALTANMGKLLAFGGCDGESKLNSVEVYDPKMNTWTFTKPILKPKYGVGIGVLDFA